MEAAKLRVQIKAAAAGKKDEGKAKERASSSAPKAVGKRASKRKADGKDNRPSKKVSSTPREELPKKPLPPKHGAGKGLMTTSGPVIMEIDRRLLTHKDYAVKMMESIIKDQDIDPYAEQGTEELGASGLFALARVHFCLPFLDSLIFIV